MAPDFSSLARGIEGSILGWRRHIHAHPELSFAEFDTTKYIASVLEEIGCENIRIGTHGLETGVLADITGASPGKCVALRADIDALPIQEESGVEFSSVNEGVMHACGHDTHTAMLLGAASLLHGVKDRLCGSVRLIFQPSEESALISQGAPCMIESGALDGVDAVFGVHVQSHVRTGLFQWNPGPMMACSDSWKVVIHGKGGHGAMPHETRDPMTAAGQLICALQTFVSRELDPLKNAVITVGMLRAGTAFNVIPGEVELVGTARAFESAISLNIEDFIRRMATNIAAAFRCTADVEYSRNLPPTVNTAELARFGAEAAKGIFGEENVEVSVPVMGGEDFSFYLQKKPGAFFYIGVGDEALGTTWPHHHCRFAVDEKQLWKGSAFEAQLAWNFLNR